MESIAHGPILAVPDEKNRNKKFEYRPALEGLRGLAVVAVVLFHADTPGLDNGFAGVDVFFVLSGFLITSIIYTELINSEGQFNFLQFYARRARRLLPASLTALVITAIVYKSTSNPLYVYENRDSFVAAAFYSANWRLLSASVDYFAPSSPSPVMHFWSLSVEEQFYFIWPIMFFFLVRFTNTATGSQKAVSKRLLGAVSMLCLAALIRTMTIRDSAPMRAYLGTAERSYQLFAGALAGLTLNLVDFSSQSPRLGEILTWVGLGGPLLLGTSALTQATEIGLFTTLCTLTLIFGLEIAPKSQVAGFLSLDALRSLGKWSYSIYLWHWPLVVIGDSMDALPSTSFLRTAVVTSLSVACGVVGFNVIEKPFTSISILNRPTRNGLVLCRCEREDGSRGLSCWNVAIVGTGLVMTCLVGFICFSVLQVPEQTLALIEGNPLTNSGDDAMIVESSQPCAAAEPARNSLFLAGDSYAKGFNWAFTHLQQNYNFNYTVRLAVACPWFYSTKFYSPGTGDLTDRCLKLQKAIGEEVRTGEHDTLVLANIGTRRSLGEHGLDPGDPGWAEAIREGSLMRLKEWKPFVNHIVILKPFLVPEEDPRPCVVAGGTGDDCDVPAEVVLGHPELYEIWDSIAEEMEGVRTVSMTDFFCPGGKVCPGITPTTGRSAWEDKFHPSREMMLYRSSKLVYTLEDNCVSLTEPHPIC